MRCDLMRHWTEPFAGPDGELLDRAEFARLVIHDKTIPRKHFVQGIEHLKSALAIVVLINVFTVIFSEASPSPPGFRNLAVGPRGAELLERHQRITFGFLPRSQ